MVGRVSAAITGPVFLVLVGLGFQVSELKSNELAIAFWVLGAVWLLLNVFFRDRIPQFRIGPPPHRAKLAAGARSMQIRKAIRRRGKTARPDYRDALKQVARALYANEGLYSESSGGGEISDEGVWVEEAPKTWGDDLYERLGLPPEDEYR